VKGKSLIAENLELAYQTWRECGQNDTETARRLEAKGFKLSRQTVIEWKEKYNWLERSARVEAEDQRARSATDNLQTKLLTSLVIQQQRYDAYFTTIAPRIDTYAITAYTALVKTIAEIDRKKMIAKTAEEVSQIAKQGGLTEQTAQQIREQILGIGK
jgi:hypothetical protein